MLLDPSQEQLLAAVARSWTGKGRCAGLRSGAERLGDVGRSHSQMGAAEREPRYLHQGEERVLSSARHQACQMSDPEQINPSNPVSFASEPSTRCEDLLPTWGLILLSNTWKLASVLHRIVVGVRRPSVGEAAHPSNRPAPFSALV